MEFTSEAILWQKKRGGEGRGGTKEDEEMTELFTA